MKNRKNLYSGYLLGAIIFFVVFVLIFILFKRWNLFDLNKHSLESIVIEGIIASIIFSVLLSIYSKRYLKKNEK